MVIQKNGKLIFSSIFNVSRETISILELFETILLDKVGKINIIGKSTAKHIWLRHFADSAKIFRIMESTIQKKEYILSVADIGSGGGFPGLILELLNKEKKLNIEFTLIESNKKKCDFLIEASKKLGLKPKIINERAEVLDKKYDVIVARAVAPLNKLMYFSQNIKKDQTIYIFPKGKNWKEEMTELKKKWHFHLNVVKNNIEIDKTGGVTLIFSKVKKRL